MNRDIVILSTADWDNPTWTNKQHVAVELARRGFRVFYVNSLGLRRPSVSGRDLRRIIRRLRLGFQKPREVRRGLWVWSPLAIPLQGNRILRRINRFVVSQSLYFWLRALKFKREILWTYNPMTTEFLRLLDFRTTVYHCVDDIKTQPDMPVQEIQTAEDHLIAGCSICFVTSQQLLENCRRINSHTHYFPNVADYQHFSKALSDQTPLPDELHKLPRPIIGFVGAISSYKVNFDLIRSLGAKHPEWSIVMIGQIGEGDPHTDVSTLNSMGNLHLLGPRRYADLPHYLKAFDVAILPSNLNDYTRSMFPMKFFEYLAAGKPVVATDLNALHPFRDFAYLAIDSADFAKGVEAALRGEGPSLESRLELAQQQTYERRTEKMLQLIPGELLG